MDDVGLPNITQKPPAMPSPGAYRDALKSMMRGLVNLEDLDSPVNVPVPRGAAYDMIQAHGWRFIPMIRDAWQAAVVGRARRLEAYRRWGGWGRDKVLDSRSFLQELSKVSSAEFGTEYEGPAKRTPLNPVIRTDGLQSVRLSDITAEYIQRPVTFDCTVIGIEIQHAVPSYYHTHHEKSNTDNMVEVEKYSADVHGDVVRTVFEDSQFLLVEEDGDEHSKDKTPRKIPARIYGELVGKFEVGDPIRMSGMLDVEDAETKAKTAKSKFSDYRYYFMVACVEKTSQKLEIVADEDVIGMFRSDIAGSGSAGFMEKLTSSFAPHIVENMIPKLLCLIVAVGSIDLAEYRREMHGYLVGNPGTGKSDLIKCIARLRYMAAYADAPGASARGLVYGQEEFGKHKILKAGLLVKHQLLCLDELDKMKEERRDINTVLEQQVASYHKAGFDKDTPTSVSFLAAGNPKNGRWRDRPLMDNLEPVEPELLSRMMIVRVIKTQNTRRRIQHILDRVQERANTKPLYTEEQLSMFISYARKLKPSITEEAEKALVDFLTKFEQIEQDNDANLPIETRQEIEIIRISTAIAKLLLMDAVDKKCVEMGIWFFKECMGTLGVRTEEAPVQMNMQGTAASRDDAFWMEVNNLMAEIEGNTFTEFDILQSMMLTNHWKTPEAARSYWERVKASGKIYEPEPGRFKRT